MSRLAAHAIDLEKDLRQQLTISLTAATLLYLEGAFILHLYFG